MTQFFFHYIAQFFQTLSKLPRASLRHVLFMACLFLPVLSSASTLVIVSDRSASTLVGGTHLYLEQNADKEVLIRTVSQLNALDDNALTSLLKQQETLLILSVFGELVERLLNQPLAAKQNRWVMQGDRRLLSLNNIGGKALFSELTQEQINLLMDALEENSDEESKRSAWLNKNLNYQSWFQARMYWQNRHIENSASLLSFIDDSSAVQPIEEISSIRLFEHAPFSDAKQRNALLPLKQFLINPLLNKPIVWVIDHDTGDRPSDWDLHKQLCSNIQWQCISVLAGWGAPSVSAIEYIEQIMNSETFKDKPWLIVSLQDFVVGGGEGRETVTELFSRLNVPVLKGLRLTEWTQAQWDLSSEGLPTDSVHYRIAMPELQGLGQAAILSVAADDSVDVVTGARLVKNEVLSDELWAFSARIDRWLSLQSKANADKKVAIIYYNHPPGRHNIGADNLNVPASLFQILKLLQAEGYQTGTLPETEEALLDLLQAKGVNLPNDKKALADSAGELQPLSLSIYQKWFQTLPQSMQLEMVSGPIAQVHQIIKEQFSYAKTVSSADDRNQQFDTLNIVIANSLNDLHHALDGVRHKGRERALDLLAQLKSEYDSLVKQQRQKLAVDWDKSDALSKALIDMKVEGLRGWGKAPGEVMVWQDNFVIPGIRLGNVFLGPQPPRGWELNEELLHANMSFPPTHQYLAFYLYLREVFGADALVHVGRHSTYEFLPKRSVGLGASDYPGKLIGALPSIYPYIVDGVGEGIQAKRRGSAIMIDHLTPPLAITELYDDLLALRQLIESAEAANDEHTRSRAVTALRKKIDDLGLKEALESSMNEELSVRGIGFDQIDDEFLLHEVGHYLTNIQEQFMPLGLHIFGRDWQPDAVETMLSSMKDKDKHGQSNEQLALWRTNLVASPKKEAEALINALAGGFVSPGKGNDPIRTPEALPTGRNFFALDGGLLPTRLGYDLGREIALKAQTSTQKIQQDEGVNKQAIILWASDAVRDEGAMIGFGMSLLGVRPVWNSRGIVKGLERLPLDETLGKRQDVLFTTSGLFRDLYGKQIHLLDKAVLMALDASASLIENQFPILRLALDAALEPLGEMRSGGSEPLSSNLVAANWLAEAQALLTSQGEHKLAYIGRQASLRIFGTAPGAYGAGINRLVERSGSWEDRKELGLVYIKRMGHAYGMNVQGDSAIALFQGQLAKVSQTYLGRASNLYGLLDNNDAFDYLGGLNMAIETVTGNRPKSSVINHADENNVKVEALPAALLSELQGRFLNPQWIKSLMAGGYSGARTMGSEFIEYLWGWQVTSPDIINGKVWESVKSVYIDDAHDLGLDAFLSEGHNRYVQTNILAVMLTAIDKGFWEASPEVIAQLAEQFAQNINQHGIPGSGHTHANHPVYDFVKNKIDPQLIEPLEAALAASRMTEITSEPTVSHVQEITFDDATQLPEQDQMSESSEAGSEQSDTINQLFIVMLIALSVLVGFGFWRGRHSV